jgi:hypothetical protein
VPGHPNGAKNYDQIMMSRNFEAERTTLPDLSVRRRHGGGRMNISAQAQPIALKET